MKHTDQNLANQAQRPAKSKPDVPVRIKIITVVWGNFEQAG